MGYISRLVILQSIMRDKESVGDQMGTSMGIYRDDYRDYYSDPLTLLEHQ